MQGRGLAKQVVQKLTVPKNPGQDLRVDHIIERTSATAEVEQPVPRLALCLRVSWTQSGLSIQT